MKRIRTEVSIWRWVVGTCVNHGFQTTWYFQISMSGCGWLHFRLVLTCGCLRTYSGNNIGIQYSNKFKFCLESFAAHVSQKELNTVHGATAHAQKGRPRRGNKPHPLCHLYWLAWQTCLESFAAHVSQKELNTAHGATAYAQKGRPRRGHKPHPLCHLYWPPTSIHDIPPSSTQAHRAPPPPPTLHFCSGVPRQHACPAALLGSSFFGDLRGSIIWNLLPVCCLVVACVRACVRCVSGRGWTNGLPLINRWCASTTHRTDTRLSFQTSGFQIRLCLRSALAFCFEGRGVLSYD